MIKCQFCGKEYMKNPYKYMDSLPEIFKKNLEYIPACNCLEENKIRELEELEKKRVQECMKNKMKKCRDISVMDEKFARSRFESADMKSDYMQLSKRYAESFMSKEKKEGMLLYGGVGTGKTFASACIANYLMERGKTVLE